MNTVSTRDTRHQALKITGVSLILMFLGFHTVYSCGGGVVPYVPTQSGASGSSTSGSFFLMEKGVAVDMFDVKKLQPLFRNIVLSGNERKVNKKIAGTLKNQQSEAACDSSNMKHNILESDSTLPVLNLHRIH